MKHIVFDIETIPQDEAKLLALAPEFTAAANLKDPEKIAASIAKKRADYLADAALNWKTAEKIRNDWGGTFCLKGVMSAADARRAVEIGADAIYNKINSM